jgi:hypothetical protein
MNNSPQVTPVNPVNQVPPSAFTGIPFKAGGNDRAGLDCVGLARLYLNEELGLQLPPARPHDPKFLDALLKASPYKPELLLPGDVVIFAYRSSTRARHVAVYLGDNNYLHTLRGLASRIDHSTTLLQRLNLYPIAQLRPSLARSIAADLSDQRLGDAVTFILLGLSIVLSLASYLLAPKMPRLGNKYGRYSTSFGALTTQTDPELPLPDLLGSVVVAGNCIYTQLPTKSNALTESPPQACSKIVLLASGPICAVDFTNSGLMINGLNYTDKYFKDGTYIDGIHLNPAQNYNEALAGTAHGDTYVPSVTLYTGAYGIAVPVDVRSQWDRTAPTYGLSGCAYLYFRLIDGSKFQGFNVTCRVKGRLTRTFNASGFITATGGDSLVTNGTSTRYKLSFEDIASVTTLTVGGVSYNPLSATAQSGNVYQLNKTKGYLEFLTAPASSQLIVIGYSYYVRAWSQNPADHLVYLLTDHLHGKGFPDDRIDWTAAYAFQTYCAQSVTWQNSNGTTTQPRFTTNYAIDFRKPIQEHLKALLDASYAYLFLSNGKFVLKARKAEDSVFSFNPSNILLDDQGKSTFHSSLADRSERPNRLKICYHSEESFNAETEISIDHEDDQRSRAPRMGNDGVLEENYKFPAVTNQPQAERLGQILLEDMVNSRWLVEFTTNIQGLPLEPGDVIDVTHPSQPAWTQKLFRIEDLQLDENDRLKIRASEYCGAAYI